MEEGGLRLSDYPAVYVHHLFELYQLLQQQQQQQQQRIVAIGEIGLDYDRLHFCDAAMQKESVKKTQTLNPSGPQMQQPKHWDKAVEASLLCRVYGLGFRVCVFLT